MIEVSKKKNGWKAFYGNFVNVIKCMRLKVNRYG